MIDLQAVEKVVVGSMNPVKIEAVREAVSYFVDHPIEVVGIAAPSGVSDMPLSEEETTRGAYQRAIYSMEQTGADISFGLEGGVDFQTDIFEREVCYLYGIVVAVDREGEKNIGYGGRFILPVSISQQLRQGAELGPLMDELLATDGVSRGTGSYGFFTKQYITRKRQFSDIVAKSLVPWVHPNLYLSESDGA